MLSDLDAYKSAVVDSIPQSVILLNVINDELVLTNKQFSATFGETAGQSCKGSELLQLLGVADDVVGKIMAKQHLERFRFEAASANKANFTCELNTMTIGLADHVLVLLQERAVRKQIEEIPFSEIKQVKLTLDSIDDAVVTTDKRGTIIYMNPTAERYSGISATAARFKSLDQILNLFDPTNGEKVQSLALNNLLPNPNFEIRNNYRLLLPDGASILIEENSAPLKDHLGELVGLIIVLRDVTELRELIADISYRACHDDLTGLINRREFEGRLTTVLDECRMDKSEHALLYLDLDQFKIINDTCGHVAGDNLLKSIATLLENQVRAHDLLARFGGDEFAILLEHCSQDKAVIIAEKIRKELKDYRFSWGAHVFSIGVSVGIVPINQEQNDLSHIMSLADTACYSAKQAGRNRIHLYKPEDTAFADRYGEMRWIPIVSKAVDEDRILLYYQTIAPAIANEEQGEHYEILMRMIDGDQIIPPGIIIPAAENFNLITVIDRWVVAHTFQWLAEHPAVLKRLGVCSINLSAQTVVDDRILGFIESELERYEIPPHKICFEITETTAISNFERANRFIKHVKRLGCIFALDDFGTGMCSFYYLKNLPVDYLKIDGMFVRNIIDSEVDRTIVQSFNQIAHVMGMQTVAEFVENDEIKNELIKMGVDFLQGFGIDKPKPLDGLI